MEDMFPFYESVEDIARDITIWAADYVSMTEQLARP